MANVYKNEAGTWINWTLPKESKIKTYDKSTLFRMPDSGEYRGYVFYLANTLVNPSKKNPDDFYVGIPLTFEIRMRNGDEEKTLPAEDFANLFEDVTALDYHADASRERPKTQKTVIDVKFPRDAILEERDKSYKIAYPGEEGAIVFFGKSIVEIPVRGDVCTAHVPGDETTVYPKEGDKYSVKIADLKKMFASEMSKDGMGK